MARWIDHGESARPASPIQVVTSGSSRSLSPKPGADASAAESRRLDAIRCRGIGVVGEDFPETSIGGVEVDPAGTAKPQPVAITLQVIKRNPARIDQLTR